MGQRDRIIAFLHLAQEELDAASWLVERSPIPQRLKRRSIVPSVVLARATSFRAKEEE